MKGVFPSLLPKELRKQATIFYLCLFAFSYLLLALDRSLALIFLGSAFILLGPFIVIERNSIPIKNIFVTVSAALVSVFVGGVLWNLALLV